MRHPAELAAMEVARSARLSSVAGDEPICIGEGQHTVHVVSEAAAVFLGIPFLLWAATTSSSPLARAGLRTMAAATLVIDGGLLLHWLTRKP